MLPDVKFRFKPPGDEVETEFPVRTEWEYEDIRNETIKVSLDLAGVTQRDQVVSALKSAEYQTRFGVLRCFGALIPHSINEQGEQLYSPELHDLFIPFTPDPFIIDEGQHPYVYAAMRDRPNQDYGLKLHQVEFQERFHYYYQDEATPSVFYYLPDCFKLRRRLEPPYLPQMLVEFFSEDGSLEKMRASLEYVAVPVFSQERLRQAAEALRPHLPEPRPAASADPVLLPLAVDDLNQLTLSLALPNREGPGAPLQSRPGVVTKLSEEFQDQIADLSLANFQDIFEALFGKSTVVFMGEVQVGGSGSRLAATIPFKARLKELYGRVLEEVETAAGDSNIQVRLRNRIESPVTLNRIPVQVQVDGQVFPARLETLTKGGAAVDFPVALAPGEELSFRAAPDQALPPGAVPKALFGLDDVVVEPDAEAVWNAILDASVPAEYHRAITVLAFAEWFSPDTDLMAIGVDFKNGDHVVLKRDTPEAKARVRTPISDLVLRQVTESVYEYTIIFIYKTERLQMKKTDSLDLLIPELPVRS